jgi:hypothetical protein
LEGFTGEPVPALQRNGVPNDPPILVTTGGAP